VPAQIYFPPKAAFDHPKAGTEITPAMIPSVSKYAGQQLLAAISMSVLVGLGLWHARRNPEEAEVRVRQAVPASS
jgi:hypothetical protein